MERRLAAIIAADVVGYSRLIGVDEIGTLAAVKSVRQEVIEPKARQFHGRIVKLMGDGALMEFPSAVDAVAFAVELQRAIAERNMDVPEDRQIVYRIGINVGDIVIEDDDIFGDGVNIATRLEGLAKPGGICISARVHDHVGQNTDIRFDDLGEIAVKNIATPVHVFQIEPEPEPKHSTPETGAALSKEELPTISVLPFMTLDDESDHRFFATGLTEDLITALCRVPDLRVVSGNATEPIAGHGNKPRQIARELGVRYLVMGGVRGTGQRLRVTAQLIDGVSGNYVWSDRYDRADEDIFAVQDDIVRRVLVELQVQLTAGEAARISSRGTQNLEAWLQNARGWSELTNWDRDSTLKALSFFEAAVESDPNWGLPLMLLGITYRELAVRGWAGYTDEDFRKGLEMVEKAVELTPGDPFIISQLGEFYMLMGRADKGIPICEKALELAPSDGRLLPSVAMNFIRAGLYDRALALFEHIRRVSPFPSRFNLANEGLALHMLGQHEEAARLLAERSIPDASVRLAALEVDRGNQERAKAIIAHVLKNNPNATVDEYAGRLLFADVQRAEWYGGLLRAAGLPNR